MYIFLEKYLPLQFLLWWRCGFWPGFITYQSCQTVSDPVSAVVTSNRFIKLFLKNSIFCDIVIKCFQFHCVYVCVTNSKLQTIQSISCAAILPLVYIDLLLQTIYAQEPKYMSIVFSYTINS